MAQRPRSERPVGAVPEAIAVHLAPGRVVVLAVLGVAMTAVSWWVATNGGTFDAAFGWAGVVFFGACTAAWAIRAVRFTVTREAVITVGPEGLHDRRVTREAVPWTAVTGGVNFSV